MDLNLAGLVKKPQVQATSTSNAGVSRDPEPHPSDVCLNLAGMIPSSKNKRKKKHIDLDRLMGTHPPLKQKRKVQSAQSSNTQVSNSKDANAGCSVQLFDEDRNQLQPAFQWNSKFFAAIKAGQSIPESGGILGSDTTHCHVFGHYEFAGGGGAEVAAAAVAAKLPGVTVDVVSQADWDKGKLKALNLNMPASCKFRDIMNTVDSHEIKNLPEIEVVLTQEQILASLGYSRCRNCDDAPPGSSASSFSGKPSESESSDLEVESESSSSSDSSSSSSRNFIGSSPTARVSREGRSRSNLDSTHRTDGDEDNDGSLGGFNG